MKDFLFAPALGLYGIQRIHLLPDAVVLCGAGVGGGSLVYANTLYVPPTEFFQDPQWAGITDWERELAPYYDQAERMYHVHGEIGHDPTEPPRGPFPYAPIPHGDFIARMVEKLKAQGLHPGPLPLGRPAGEPRLERGQRETLWPEGARGAGQESKRNLWQRAALRRASRDQDLPL